MINMDHICHDVNIKVFILNAPIDYHHCYHPWTASIVDVLICVLKSK